MQNKKNVMSINSSNYCTSCGQMIYDKVIKNKSHKKFIISEPSEKYGEELLILTPRAKKKRSKSVDTNKSHELDSSSKSGEIKNSFSKTNIIKSKSSIDTSCDHSRSRSKSRRESLDVLKDTNKSFEKNQIKFIRNMDLNEDEIKLINDRIYNVLNYPNINNNLLKVISFIPNSLIFYSTTNKLYKIIEDKEGLKEILNCQNIKNYKFSKSKSITINQLALELTDINSEIYCNIFKQIKYLTDPPLDFYIIISKEIIKIKIQGDGFFDKNKVAILTLYTIYIDWFQSKSKMYIK